MVENDRYGLGKRIVRHELSKRLARAQNRSRVRNAQGRLVKPYHSAFLPVRESDGRIVQKQLCGERTSLSASFAHASIEQRHKQIEGMCRATFRSVDDLNQNNGNLVDNQLRLGFHFSYVAEPIENPAVETIPASGPIRPHCADGTDHEELRSRKPR